MDKQNIPYINTEICGAKTKKGTPCRNRPMANGRCRLHGGKSTGPKDKSKHYNNKFAQKHGLFSKYLPKETLDIITEIEEVDPIELLWDNIMIQYAAIIRAQHIMYVEGKDELVTLLKREDKVTEYEYHTAWDRHEKFLNSQARAMNNLTNMILKYDKLCNSELATEEQKLRTEKLKAEIGVIKKINEEGATEKQVGDLLEGILDAVNEETN